MLSPVEFVTSTASSLTLSAAFAAPAHSDKTIHVINENFIICTLKRFKIANITKSLLKGIFKFHFKFLKYIETILF